MSIEMRGMFATAEATALVDLPYDLSGYCQIIGELRRASAAKDLGAKDRDAAGALADRMSRRVLVEVRGRFPLNRRSSGALL